MMKRIFIALSITLLGAQIIAAQDTAMVKEVTVSQEFNPIVKDAFKISTAPKTETPKSSTPTFEYNFFNVPQKTDYQIKMLKADEYTPTLLATTKGKQNYVKAGGGNYSTIMGELFYNAYESKNQKVNIFYRNRSSWGKVRLQDDSKVKAPNINNYGLIDFQRRYRYSKLNSSIVFDRESYRYYGYNTIDTSMNYTYANDTTAVALDNGKQALTNIGFNLEFASLPRISADIDYKIDFNFNSLINEDQFSENQFTIGGYLEKNFNNLSVGFDAGADVGFYGKPKEPLAREYMGETFFDVEITPFIAFNRKNWDLKVGAKLEYYQMDSIKAFVPTPVVDLNFYIVPKYFSAFLTSNGKVLRNTYAEVVKVNPFVANDIERLATRKAFDVAAGFTGNPIKELSLKLSVNYQYIKNQMFFVNEFVTDVANPTIDNAYTNRFIAEYDDNNLLIVHGEANYNSFKSWAVGASFDYYGNSLKTLPEAWNMPEYKISAFGQYYITDKITARGSFDFLPKRAIKVSSANDVNFTSATYDLTLNGEYRFRDYLSFFLDLNNLLGSNHCYYNGYSAYRFSALAGASFRF